MLYIDSARFLQGFEKDLERTALRPGTFYVTVDSGKLLFDTLQGRMLLIMLPYPLDDMKENDYEQNTFYKVEEQTGSRDKTSSDPGYRCDFGDSDLSPADYESWIHRFRSGELY